MKAVVEIIGEYQSFQRMVTGTVAGSSTLKREFTELSLSASKSAEAQVKSSALKISRMREEIAAVQSVSAAYKRGSDEQIAAMTLVARKQAELSRLTGVSSYGVCGGSSRRRDEREASGLTRGLLSGGGIEHVGLAALSGGAFFGAFTAAHAARSSLDAATGSVATEKQLAAQYKASGQVLGDYRKQIDETLDRESALSGFNKDELTKSYTTLFRAAGDTTKALRDDAIAADLARGRHVDLQAAALLVSKVINGNVGLLKRYGIETYKGETATEALAAIQQKYAGQAAAGATAQEKFTAQLHNSEVIIGTALLPTVTHLLKEGADWLDQMNRSGKLQKDVNTAIHDAAGFVHLLEGGVHVLVGTIKLADDVTGSFTHTLELLVGLKLLGTFSGWASGIKGVGTEAEVAGGQVAGLKGKLADLTALGTVAVTIDIIENFIPKAATKGGQKILDSEGLGALGKIPLLGPALQTGTFLGRKTGEGLGINYGPSTPKIQVPAFVKTAAGREAFAEGLSGQRLLVADMTPEAFAAYKAGLTAGHHSAPSITTNAAASGVRPGGGAPGSQPSLFALSHLQSLNLALAKNPDSRAAIEAKLAYDKQAAAFAEKRIAEGRGSKSLVDQLSKVYSDMDSLNSQLASMSKKSLDAETKAAKQRTEDGKKAQKALEDSAKQQQQLFDQAKQTAFGVLGPLGGGPVLTGPAAQFVQQYGGHVSGKAYLQDITQQNKAARGELTNLNTLRRRGAPQDLITSILGQGTAGQGMAQALAHATPAVLKAFLGQYRERQQTAIQLARMQVATMHVDKIVTTGGQTRTDAHDRPSTNKFGRVPTAGRRR